MKEIILKRNYDGISLDPRTLFIVNIAFCITIFLVSTREANHFCLLISFLLMNLVDLKIKSFKFVVVYGVILFAEWLSGFYGLSELNILVGLIGYIVCKLIPILMIATILVNRVKTSELITALGKMKVPRGLMLAIVVSLRFVPTIKNEMLQIKQSMSMRGIEPNFINLIKKPILTIEYFIVPLLFRSLKIAEELTATALTRGVENDVERSSYFNLTFRKVDYIVSIFVVVALSSLYVMDKGLLSY